MADIHAQGRDAFRRGEHALARARFEQAHRLLAETRGAEAAETLEALSDLGAACTALGEHAAARAAHESVLETRRRVLGSAHPAVGTSLHNLGTVLRALGQIEAAEACHVESLGIWQAALGDTHLVLAKSLGALGLLARARGDAPAALHYAQQSLVIRRKNLPETDPQMVLAYDDLANALTLAGDDAGAARAWQAALDVLQRRYGPQSPHAAPILNNLGVASSISGDLHAAKTWFAASVAADPDLAIARHHLAACLARLGETAEARRARGLALARQSVFIQKAARGDRPRVLIPSVSDDGNVPLEHILPQRDFTRIWWFIGHGEDQAKSLPPYDMVFNGIGDPDMAGAAGPALEAFLRENGKPVFNHPDAIVHTRRDLLPARLAGIEGLVVPPAFRLHAGDSLERARGIGVAPPLLLRPAGSHGGSGLRRLDGWADIDLSAAPAWYLSPFIDVSSPDGFFRKYRMAFVDRRPYPYHLAISPDWLVHYFSADMPAHPWKLAEEAVFLADARAALGAPAYDAIAAAGRRLDLDFCGVDFTVLADGRALVFEANATMLIHPETETGKLAFKNQAVQEITEAVGQFLLKT